MRASPTPTAPDLRRALVHQAVRELMADQGFRISMDSVAARAGCSKQTLYAHFGSKQELLRSVIAEHQDLATARLSPAVEDPRTALLAFATQHLRHLCDPAIVATSRLMTAEAHQFPDEARDLYRQACDTLVQRLATWLQHAMDQGQLRHDDPHYAAELLLSMIVGMDFDRQRFGGFFLVAVEPAADGLAAGEGEDHHQEGGNADQAGRSGHQGNRFGRCGQQVQG